MDATRLISLPTIRRELMKQGVQRLLDAGALQGLSAVAGGESSGIAFAAWFAEKLDMPLQYVRKRPVGSRQIEGVVHSGGKVLLVDDMVSAGQYKLNFIEALRTQGRVWKTCSSYLTTAALAQTPYWRSTVCACMRCATGRMYWPWPSSAAGSP